MVSESSEKNERERENIFHRAEEFLKNKFESNKKAIEDTLGGGEKGISRREAVERSMARFALASAAVFALSTPGYAEGMPSSKSEIDVQKFSQKEDGRLKVFNFVWQWNRILEFAGKGDMLSCQQAQKKFVDMAQKEENKIAFRDFNKLYGSKNYLLVWQEINVFIQEKDFFALRIDGDNVKDISYNVVQDKTIDEYEKKENEGQKFTLGFLNLRLKTWIPKYAFGANRVDGKLIAGGLLGVGVGFNEITDKENDSKIEIQEEESETSGRDTKK